MIDRASSLFVCFLIIATVPMKSSSPALIAFDVQFEEDLVQVKAPVAKDKTVSANALQKALAVKLRGRLDPSAKGFFVVTNDEGFEKELCGDDDVSMFEKILFELGETKKERKAALAAKNAAAATKETTDASTNQLIKEKLQRRRFQSVLRIKKESAAGGGSAAASPTPPRPRSPIPTEMKK